MKTALPVVRVIASRFRGTTTLRVSPLVLFAWAPIRLSLLVIATALVCGKAQASDPVGIYALVDKVVLEPGNDSPERIQVWGVFSIARPGGGVDQYLPPQRGYLYYQAKPAKKAVSEKEWADLKAIAGTHQCVAFGSRWAEKGRVRKPGEKPTQPDEYPVAQGITKVRDNNYPPVKKLFDLAESKSTANEPLVKAPK